MSAQTQPILERLRQSEASGQHEDALAGYVQLRRFADAARVAWQLGRHGEAARYYAEAGMFFECAACHQKAGATRRCFEALLHVAKDHPSYGRACRHAIRIAQENNLFDFSLDHFVSKYLAAPPADERDLDAFDAMARFYERDHHDDNAREVLQRIAAVNPAFRDAAKRLDRLTKPIRAVDATIAEEAMAFQQHLTRKRNTTEMAALPELPDLPPAPSGAPVARPRTITGVARAVRSDTLAVPAPAPRVTRSIESMPALPVAAAPAEGDAIGPGTVLSNRYHVVKKIGEGGMATVYRARDAELEEDLAIKVFQSDDAQHLQRFRQEVALSRQLAHPNVIRLYDIGTHGRVRFLTMELLEGASLDTRLGRPVDLAYGVKLLIHACSGLGAAHGRGIVHRDIKPSNFFLTRDGALKLMDFGIAKRQSTGEGAGLTVAGFIAGTPAYMSPDQINNFAKAGAVSDLYSLGIMAYEIFTGEVPFMHEDLMSLLMMHARDTPPPLRAAVPSAPAPLEAVVASMLAKDPAQRPQSCEALALQLRAILPELAR